MWLTVDLTAEFDTVDDYNHEIKAGQSYLSGHSLSRRDNT